MKFSTKASTDQQFDKMYASKDWTVGDVKYFLYLETLTGFGKNASTLHVFHPAELKDGDRFSYDDTKKVACWGCDVLDKNIAANLVAGQAAEITLKATPAGKKYYNFVVGAGDLVLDQRPKKVK